MFIFWDLKKAFDKVPRSAMWVVLAGFRCPFDFITLVRSLNEGMFGRVCHQNALSDPFPIHHWRSQTRVSFSSNLFFAVYGRPPCSTKSHREHTYGTAWMAGFSISLDLAQRLRHIPPQSAKRSIPTITPPRAELLTAFKG